MWGVRVQSERESTVAGTVNKEQANLGATSRKVV